MNKPCLSPRAIAAVTQAVTGGSSTSDAVPRYGVYRTGPQLVQLFGDCDIDLVIGSRAPSVHERLTTLNRVGEFVRLRRVIEAAVDPHAFGGDHNGQRATLDYVNDALRPDGYELRPHKGAYRLERSATAFAVTQAVQAEAAALNYDSVQRDLEHAVQQADTDPEGAITAACSLVESVCRCILEDLGQPLPKDKDIAHLAATVQEHLNLSPARSDIGPDIKQILNGLRTLANGIGALRTHAGDAHGRGRKAARIDSRIARLAIHAASTLSLFFIETWQRRRDEAAGGGH